MKALRFPAAQRSACVAAFGRRIKGSTCDPIVRQIAGITQLVTIVFRAVFGTSTSAAPPRIRHSLESQMIHPLNLLPGRTLRLEVVLRGTFQIRIDAAGRHPGAARYRFGAPVCGLPRAFLLRRREIIPRLVAPRASVFPRAGVCVGSSCLADG